MLYQATAVTLVGLPMSLSLPGGVTAGQRSQAGSCGEPLSGARLEQPHLLGMFQIFLTVTVAFGNLRVKELVRVGVQAPCWSRLPPKALSRQDQRRAVWGVLSGGRQRAALGLQTLETQQ